MRKFVQPTELGSFILGMQLMDPGFGDFKDRLRGGPIVCGEEAAADGKDPLGWYVLGRIVEWANALSLRLFLHPDIISSVL